MNGMTISVSCGFASLTGDLALPIDPVEGFKRLLVTGGKAVSQAANSCFAPSDNKVALATIIHTTPTYHGEWILWDGCLCHAHDKEMNKEKAWEPRYARCEVGLSILSPRYRRRTAPGLGRRASPLTPHLRSMRITASHYCLRSRTLTRWYFKQSHSTRRFIRLDS